MSKRTLLCLAFEDVDQNSNIILSPEEGDEGLIAVDDSDLQGAHDDSDKIDELISTTGALEKIEQAVQGSIEQGGLGAQTAQALDVAFEHFKARLDLADGKKLSLEGFVGGASTRRVATRVALEEMGETIRRLVKKLLAWIKHVAQLCYDVIERIAVGANAVIDRSQVLYKAASALAHNKFNQDKIKDLNKSSLVSFFNDHGKPMTAHDIIHRYAAFCDDVNKAFNAGKMFDPATTALRELERFVNGNGENSVDLGAVEGFAAAAVDEFVQQSLHGYSARNQDGADVIAKELPFGNASMVFSFMKGATDDTKRVGFNAVIEPSQIDNAAALTPMKPQEVMNLMTVLTAQMSKGIYRESKNIKKAIHEVAIRVEKEGYKLSDRQRHLGSSVVPTLHLIKTISDSSMKLTRLLYSYSGVTTRRLLAYGEASLAVYSNARIS